MATKVVRFVPVDNHSAEPAWGVQFDQFVAPLRTTFKSTGEFVSQGGIEQAKHAKRGDASLRLADLRLLSPVTTNQQFLCQGVNYESHVRESGMDPTKIGFNTIFTKASSCITGPYDDVVRPAHVRLLDYEIELGLVLKRDIKSSLSVGANKLHEVLAGVTIVNDVSARDVQLPQAQFYKGKSYRTFGPVGPCLLLLEPAEWDLWPRLRLQLKVNGMTRQDDYCGSMLNKPHDTLTELSGLHDLYAGDLIATGTPSGCAAKSPGELAMFVARHFISEQTKWKLFISGGLKNPAYLQPNDVMELSIATPDGALDLGVQRNRVVSA